MTALFSLPIHNRAGICRHNFGLLGGVLIALTPIALQAAPASGEFVANKRCELFQSKNKQTNPDNWQSNIGERYPVAEILGNSSNPDWLRVRTNAASSPLRWIKGDCGQYNAAATAPAESIATAQPAANVEPTQTSLTSKSTAVKSENSQERGTPEKRQGNVCQIEDN